MPVHEVRTAIESYPVIVERCGLSTVRDYVPATAGKVFVITTEDVWQLHAARLSGLKPAGVLFYPGGEHNKRLAVLETLAEQMVTARADRASVIVAFGGGIVGDVGGFLAAVFMRGVPVIQVPTTLVAQVDAAVGGKTGVNLSSGKNLIGSFHQPRAVVIDPEVLATLPEREYRAGLFEVVKHGIIRSQDLFSLMAMRAPDVLARNGEVVDRMVDESVRIKAAVVSADEKEGGLRRILNFGHTFGHALEAETGYTRFLHGEAVGWGMRAATRLGVLTGHLGAADAELIEKAIALYGPVPSLEGIASTALIGRLASDKKTTKDAVHFVVPDGIGSVRVVSGVDNALVRQAIDSTLS